MHLESLKEKKLNIKTIDLFDKATLKKHAKEIIHINTSNIMNSSKYESENQKRTFCSG
jgi:hypothetical protein